MEQLSPVNTDASYSLPIPNLKVPYIVSKVNSKYGNFLKYIPDSLLNESQKKSKIDALEKDRIKYDIKPNVVLTIAEREAYGDNGRIGYYGLINDAIENGKLIDYDNKKRNDLPVNAESVKLEIVTKSLLDNNLTQFNNEINSYKQKIK